jgi:hypothetical protein
LFISFYVKEFLFKVLLKNIYSNQVNTANPFSPGGREAELVAP